jgi:hypothetical protein
MPPTHPVTSAALPNAGTGEVLYREKLTPGMLVSRITHLSTAGLVQPSTVTDCPPIDGCAAEGSAKELTAETNPAIATKRFMACSHY